MYHHAEREYVMLVSWLAEGPCTLPANASHQVGVGAFVLNEQEEVITYLRTFSHRALICHLKKHCINWLHIKNHAVLGFTLDRVPCVMLKFDVKSFLISNSNNT